MTTKDDKPVLCAVGLSWGATVLVSLDDYAGISQYYDTLESLESASTWGEMRRLEPPFDIVESQADDAEFDFKGYIEAIENANGVKPRSKDLEELWAVVKTLPFAGIGEWGAESDGDAATGAFPGDDSPFEYFYSGEYDLETQRDIDLRNAMIEAPIPEELYDEFDLVESTTLDGYLGRILEEDLEAVLARLRELGFEIEL